ncbi:hypothetical protein GCM10009827_013070 [Dactylosporangium maewongense]|uniref:Gram-positive cocci surface proteins LPxTG domain-containing protein n=1 Tax=Dactylosporangium maewongense TaxID=634393 RepID=A0ABN1ZQI8_9ACTN
MLLRIGTAAVALAATALFVSPAAAAPAEGPIDAISGKVGLSGDPYTPSAVAEIGVINSGATALEGRFILELPTGSVTVEPGQCDTGTKAGTWICSAGTVAPNVGNPKTVGIKIRSTTGEPVFQVSTLGYLQGMAPDGTLGRRNDFVVAWPDKGPLRLSAQAGPVSDGHVDVAVRVTNAGSFTFGQYYLVAYTPGGVRAVSPACTASGRIPAEQGCEIHRTGPFAAGAQDTFTIRLSVPAKRSEVELVLTPTNRYTNKDTKVKLTVGTTSATTPAPTSPAVTSPAASVSPVPALPKTGTNVGLLAVSGGLLLAAGAGLVLVGARRRFRTG